MSDSEGAEFSYSDSDDEHPGAAAVDITDPEYEREAQKFPSLLTGSATRKRTLESYRAPEKFRGQVIPCREFPYGVYIDHFGKLDPQHPRTHSLRPQPDSKRSVRTADDTDIPVRVQDDNPRPTKRQKRDVDEDEDSEATEDDEDDEDVFSEDDNENEQDIEDAEDDDDDEEESDPDYDDGSADGGSDDDDDDDDDDEDEEETLEAETNEKEEPTAVKANLVEDLKKREESHHQILNYESKSKQQRERASRLLKFCEHFIERWDELQKRSPADQRFKLDADPRFHCSDPACTFTVTRRGKRPGPKRVVTCSLNCETCQLVCACQVTTDQPKTLYQHILDHHVQ